VTRVLFLCYHFPPVGGAGVQRSVGFARHLPELGYQPVVVTGTGRATGRWTPTDVSLDGALPPEIEIHRVRPPEPPASSGRAARSERWLRRQSPFARWWTSEAVRAGLVAGQIDLVYASMSPFESADAAERIAATLGVPWVADLRDPWALDEMTMYPTASHRRLERTRMRRALASAAVVVMNTPEATRRLRQSFPELPAAWTVTNGFDADDFEPPSPAPRAGGPLRIVHTGYLHTELGRGGRMRTALGGSGRGVDILTRSHVVLLEALARLDENERNGIELHLAGVLSPADLASLDPRVVKTHGYLPHPASIELICSAGLLFLPMHDLPEGSRAGIVPGKTYEYLASRRPILAAVPDGDARDLLDEAGSALLCRPGDRGEMAGLLREALARHRAGEPLRPAPYPDVVARYERRTLTRQLAALFDRALGKRLASGEAARSGRTGRGGESRAEPGVAAAESQALGGRTARPRRAS